MKINIREIRKQKGWSQKDLANRLEMHWTTISRMETGKMKIPKTVELAIKWLARHGDK